MFPEMLPGRIIQNGRCFDIRNAFAASLLGDDVSMSMALSK
jgi:hypothetical protein